MAEHDELARLLQDAREVGRSAAASTRPPDFARLARRGRVRRRVRVGALGGGVSLAVATIVGLGAVVGRPDATPVPAGPGDPAPVVQPLRPVPPGSSGGRAPVTDIAVDPDDGRVQAVVRARDGRSAVRLSTDGFETAMQADLPVDVALSAVGDGRFLARSHSGDRTWLLDERGCAEVPVDPSPAPVAEGEVAVRADGGFLAVDPDAGTVHRVPVPDEAVGPGASSMAQGDRLITLAFERPVSTYRWSDDGGRSWRSAPVRISGVPVIVPTAAGQAHAVVDVADGATLPQLESVRTMRAEGGGFTASERVAPPRPVTSAEFLWQGRVRFIGSVYAEGAHPRTTSVYEVVDGTPRRLETEQPPLVGPDTFVVTRLVEGRPVVWIGAQDDTLVRSEDGGVTWTVQPTG